MIFINEWLPNPVGLDSAGEFIELFNNGNSNINLNGWVIKLKNEKEFNLTNIQIKSNGYLLLPRSLTKLTLKNKDETIFLFDNKNNLIDQSSYLGSAPEGKSYNRINYNKDDSQHFSFGNPTPGNINDKSIDIQLYSFSHPFNFPINNYFLNFLDVVIIFLGVAIFIIGIISYTIKKDENLSEFFFGGHTKNS
jgi:hypothetical protein